MEFPELENKIKEYMLLEDPGIVKLLCAFVIGCRLPVPPPWVFIVSSSSGGKTKLIQLLENVPGYKEIDDLTANTLLSGKKSYEGSPSLLHHVTDNGFLVFKDFTTILSKHKDQMTPIIGQLRMVYDGKFVKYTGQDSHALEYSPKKAPGLLAGVTTKIYTTSKDWGEMGERFVMYHMKQPDNREVGRWIMGKRRNEKALEAELRKQFSEFLASVTVPENINDLPEIDEATSNDLIDIAYLTVMSRSPVERNQYDKKKRIELTHDHEMIGRFLKQLQTLAYAMMLINKGGLTDGDRAILYKIGLDSIPMQRYMVMRALTENRLGGDINQLADFLRNDFDTVEIWVSDLVALGIVKNNTHYMGGRKQKTYHINPEYMEIISRFENLDIKEAPLPPSEDEKVSDSSYDSAQELSWDQITTQ